MTFPVHLVFSDHLTRPPCIRLQEAQASRRPDFGGATSGALAATGGALTIAGSGWPDTAMVGATTVVSGGTSEMAGTKGSRGGDPAALGARSEYATNSEACATCLE